jgi:hypothetical protein
MSLILSARSPFWLALSLFSAMVPCWWIAAPALLATYVSFRSEISRTAA